MENINYNFSNEFIDNLSNEKNLKWVIGDNNNHIKGDVENIVIQVKSYAGYSDAPKYWDDIKNIVGSNIISQKPLKEIIFKFSGRSYGYDSNGNYKPLPNDFRFNEISFKKEFSFPKTLSNAVEISNIYELGGIFYDNISVNDCCSAVISWQKQNSSIVNVNLLKRRGFYDFNSGSYEINNKRFLIKHSINSTSLKNEIESGKWCFKYEGDKYFSSHSMEEYICDGSLWVVFNKEN